MLHLNTNLLGINDLGNIGIPAVRIQRTIIIADLHIGYSSNSYRFSIRAREKYVVHQAEAICSMISATTNISGAQQLIILGDLKESIGFPRKYLLRALKKLLLCFLNLFEKIYIVRGNHDGKLAEILDELDFDIKIADHILLRTQLGKVLLTHGHMKAPLSEFISSQIIIMGHIHPVYETHKIFVFAEFLAKNSKKLLIIIPAMNPILHGKTINCNTILRSLNRISPSEFREDLNLLSVRIKEINGIWREIIC